MEKQSIETALKNGLAFLEHTQQPAGNFKGESYQDTGASLAVETIFDTAFILSSLGPLMHAEIFPASLGDRAIAFLQSQKREDGSYNYWDKESPYASKLGYPNDMDDTALAVAAAIAWSGEPGGETLAQLVNLLTQTELAVGGPYNTWICDFKNDTRWQDQDLGVNANIAYLLSLLHIDLPNLTAFFETCIRNDAYTSEYYLSPIVLIYFIARTYKGELVAKLAETIFKYQVSPWDWGNPLLTALAISSLLRLDRAEMPHESAIEKILAAQNENGSWLREVLYLDPSVRDVRWYHGSAAITTACALEMLALWNDHVEEKMLQKSEPASYRAEKKLIVDTFVEDAALANQHFGMLASSAIAKIEQSPISEKSMLLPFMFKDMLGKKANNIPTSMLIGLGKANLAGWIGYTIIDDIIDGEADGMLAPFGTWSIRYLCTTYRNILSQEKYPIVEELLTATEAALYRERANKLPENLDLQTLILPKRSELPTYQKSLGHALPALALLLQSGIARESELYVSTEIFFKHYLAAKQLNDDAHDVAADIQARILTQIGHIVLSHFTKTKVLLSGDALLDEKKIMEAFWYDAFDEVHALIGDEITGAKKALASLAFENTDYFQTLIGGLEHSQNVARSDRDSTISFLKSYELGHGAR